MIIFAAAETQTIGRTGRNEAKISREERKRFR
jgi:hypothetical protein